MKNTERMDGPSAGLGEGPLWDARIGRLWWVDIDTSLLHCFDPVSGDTRTVVCAEPSLSMVVPSTDGGLVAAVESGLVRIDPATGLTTRISRLTPGVGLRMNDGNVDPQGRLWVGSMAYDYAPGGGALYRVTHDRHDRVLERVTCSNGVGWSPDGNVMYFVDTGSQRIVAFDFDGADGTIDGARTLVDIDPDDGGPDGIAIDVDGGIWVALWNGAEIRRYTADGRLDGRIATIAAHPTCPEFAGPALDVLYFTAADDSNGGAGGLFRVDDVGVRGLAATCYDLGADAVP